MAKIWVNVMDEPSTNGADVIVAFSVKEGVKIHDIVYTYFPNVTAYKEINEYVKIELEGGKIVYFTMTSNAL